MRNKKVLKWELNQSWWEIAAGKEFCSLRILRLDIRNNGVASAKHSFLIGKLHVQEQKTNNDFPKMRLFLKRSMWEDIN